MNRQGHGRDADIPSLRQEPVTQPAFLLGKQIQLVATEDGELHAADGNRPADPASVKKYLAKAFGDRLAEVREAMQELASRYEAAELNRIGFRLYERFRPEVKPGDEGYRVHTFHW